MNSLVKLSQNKPSGKFIQKSSMLTQPLPAIKQTCPKCGSLIGIVAGSKEAICSNCGFKDPCCE